MLINNSSNTQIDFISLTAIDYDIPLEIAKMFYALADDMEEFYILLDTHLENSKNDNT